MPRPDPPVNITWKQTVARLRQEYPNEFPASKRAQDLKHQLSYLDAVIAIEENFLDNPDPNLYTQEVEETVPEPRDDWFEHAGEDHENK